MRGTLRSPTPPRQRRRAPEKQRAECSEIRVSKAGRRHPQPHKIVRIDAEVAAGAADVPVMTADRTAPHGAPTLAMRIFPAIGRVIRIPLPPVSYTHLDVYKRQVRGTGKVKAVRRHPHPHKIVRI